LTVLHPRRSYQRSRVWRWFADADDFIAGLVLILLAVVTVGAIWLVGSRSDDRDTVLKLAGGALILFTSYSAARTLVLNRLDQRTGRIMQATQMLKEDSETIRAGALATLVDIAVSSKSRREIEQVEIIRKVLEASAMKPEQDTELVAARKRVADFLRARAINRPPSA
jgi:hypothetical protein